MVLSSIATLDTTNLVTQEATKNEPQDKSAAMGVSDVVVLA